MHAPQENPLFCPTDGYRRDLVRLDECTTQWQCGFCNEASAPIYEGEQP